MLVKANECRVLLSWLHAVRLVVQVQLVALVGLGNEVLLMTPEVPDRLLVLALVELPIGRRTRKHDTGVHCRVLTSRHEYVVLLLLLSALLGNLLLITHAFKRVFSYSDIVLLLRRNHVLLRLDRNTFVLSRQKED